MTVAGLTPRAVVEPPSIDELALVVADLYDRDAAFAFAGGGTELELGNPPRALDTLVKTTACNRLVDYDPQDQTITVEAGMTIAGVDAILGREAQFLALDAPDRERTTVGGAIATNLYGGRRLRYGSIKDRIVGVEIVRPDGVRARGGGKVVKNVAGFDMPKLMVGSLGTLGAIVSATFRVYPIEEQSAAMVYHGVSVEQMAQICRELFDEALVPAAVTAFDARNGERYDCSVLFAGFRRGVEQQMKVATAIAFRLGLSAGAYAGALAASLDDRERSVRRAGPWRIAVSARPTALIRFLQTAAFPPDSQRVVYPCLGAAFIAAETLDAATIAHWRATLEGGSVVVNAMPPQARDSVEAWGAPPEPALSLMRRLKANFDPKGLCNAGRFVGGL
jgi:glycolate oxidase FAD binding subunit